MLSGITHSLVLTKIGLFSGIALAAISLGVATAASDVSGDVTADVAAHSAVTASVDPNVDANASVGGSAAVSVGRTAGVSLGGAIISMPLDLSGVLTGALPLATSIGANAGATLGEALDVLAQPRAQIGGAASMTVGLQGGGSVAVAPTVQAVTSGIASAVTGTASIEANAAASPSFSLSGVTLSSDASGMSSSNLSAGLR